MEECCLLGIDCNERTTVGLVLRVLADTTIRLDGDGYGTAEFEQLAEIIVPILICIYNFFRGFSVSVCGRQHIFKPVSVQAMW